MSKSVPQFQIGVRKQQHSQKDKYNQQCFRAASTFMQSDQSTLVALWVAKDPSDSEDTAQTAGIHRLCFLLYTHTHTPFFRMFCRQTHGITNIKHTRTECEDEEVQRCKNVA